MAICTKCGTENAENKSYCRRCGNKLGAVAPSATVVQDQSDSRSLMVRAVAHAIGKSLLLSAAVLGPGMLLLAQGQQLVGMLWLFAGSFGMMAWTYRKPWRLVMLTCLLPPAAAFVSYLVQLILFGNALPPALLLLIAVGLGLLLGFRRAKDHEVYMQDGSVFAQRTTKYLVTWIVAYACTQILGAVAQSVFLVAAGLLTGAYATSMLLVVSVVLVRKRADLVKTVEP